MGIFSRKVDSPQGPPKNGCTCDCHQAVFKVYHCVACCPSGPETSDHKSLFEMIQEVNQDRSDEFNFRNPEES